MAPLRLLAALLAAHLQLNSGQQIIEGNNLVAVASHKLAAIKQQSQKQNITDTDQMIDSEDNLEVTTHKYLQQVNFNTNATYPGSGTMTSIKFVRNPAYDGPIPTFSIINSENSSNPIFGTLRHDAALFNLSSASPNSEPRDTGVGQGVSQQPEDNVGYISKSPLFISFAPQCSGAVTSQSPYIINNLPPQSFPSNVVALQSSPPLNQQLLQTLSSAQAQPSSVQNPANMRLRFVPASATVPLQGTGPIKSAVPIQRQVPIQTTLPVQSSVAMQNAAPVPNSVPTQSTLPIQSTIPIQSAIPIQRAIPNVPLQNPVANILNHPNLALLLTHGLSQNPVKPEYSMPMNTMCTIQDPKPTKQTTVKTLLPLLLQLLTEKNNNCCESKNKNERSHTYSRYKSGHKNSYDKFDANLSRSEGSQSHRVNQNKRLKKPVDDSLEDENYSDEMSDYSAEEYDDED